jgi:tetratricopeptide (TPR) repeat protein
MHDMSLETAIRTTNGTIALLNLHSQIEGFERQAARGRLTSRSGAELVDLLTLRGQILGRIADYERASDLAEQLAGDAPADAAAFLARARIRACLHRFAEALTDLDVAERLGLASPELGAERAAILQAVGRYGEALVMHWAAVGRRRSFETLGALAAFHAELGEITEAERLFDESRARFRGVSPFGLAQLDFQRAHMWLHQGDLARARDWLLEAWHRVPAYAPAEGHLAEVEAETGETEMAISRLRRLAYESDDPDYAAHLARILDEVGRRDEAAPWRARAEARYQELVARHPAAFADHAAEFCLTLGGDPQRALHLAKHNAAIRQTPRSHALLTRAMAACASGPPLVTARA